jgi:hypothetical protein
MEEAASFRQPVLQTTAILAVKMMRSKSALLRPPGFQEPSVSEMRAD